MTARTIPCSSMAAEPRTYRLTPGTGLARLLCHIRPGELEGYADVYYACVFFPLGVLLGIAARRKPSHARASFLRLVTVSSFSPFILELVLVRVSGRTVSLENLALSFFLLLAGCLWVNADPPVTK
jgi:hypothetical protein